MNWSVMTNELSSAIEATLRVQRGEEYFPQHNADAMDDKISSCKRRVELLRKMRNDLEDEMSRPI